MLNTPRAQGAWTRLAHLPREDRDTLFLLSVMALVVLPHLHHLPLWCSGLSLCLLLWRGWLAWRSRALPSRWWLLGLLALTLGATYLSHRTLLGRDAGVTLIVVLLSLKMLELRARRDAFVVFFLGFFTILTQFFFSQSLLTAAAMLLALWGLLTALVNAHMPAGRPPLWQPALVAGRLALLGTPVMVALFVLFPRMAPLWGTPSDALSGRSGLSAQMEVGNIAQLALDDSIAMRLKFDGPAPALRDFYLRGPVLSFHDGRTWHARGPRPLPWAPLDAQLRTQGPVLNYEVTLEPSPYPWLFVLEASPTGPQGPGLKPRMTPQLQWVLDQPTNTLMRYRASSQLQFEHGPPNAQTGLQEYRDLPPGYNPRTLQWAADLRRNPALARADASTLAQAVLERLRTGGYSYTLEPGVFGQHTADEFWFDRKAGFCEHIASSFVILMRALDVPARVVTGYQGGTQNSVDGYWVVRQSDAHAWAEIWQPGQGWLRVDPTSAVSPGRVGSVQRLLAPQGLVAGTLGTLNPTLATQLRAAWDAVNNRWNQWVLNYNQGQQMRLLDSLGFDTPSWEDLLKLLGGGLAVVALGGAVWTLLEHRRVDPWLRLLQRARQRLARAGLDVPADATPRQLLALVRALPPHQASLLETWLLALERWRYAAGDPASLATLQAEFRALPWPPRA